MKTGGRAGKSGTIVFEQVIIEIIEFSVYSWICPGQGLYNLRNGLCKLQVISGWRKIWILVHMKK